MMSTIIGLIILFVLIIGSLVYIANDSYEKKLKCELNNSNKTENVETYDSVKVIPLTSRFDHVENTTTLTTDDFVKKELTPHIADVINKESKKHLQKRVRKPKSNLKLV